MTLLVAYLSWRDPLRAQLNEIENQLSGASSEGEDGAGDTAGVGETPGTGGEQEALQVQGSGQTKQA